MEKITVHTRPAYQVTIGAGLLKTCGESIRELQFDRQITHIAIITDHVVGSLYLTSVETSLRAAGFAVDSYIFPAGEASKNIGVLSDILEFLAGIPMTRTDCLIALGGGVVGDMAGFAAAVYLRGIRYIQIPTTLLSSVDSSVGGKTAIDLKAGKNLAGAFLQPSAVLCDTDCLKTLPEPVFADGAAEAIKTGILSSQELFANFENHRLITAPEFMIAQCVNYKAGVVERDEKEQNERKLLNLGHTIGHAVEKCSDYQMPHGHAVAIGLAMISRAAEKLGWTQEAIADRVVSCLLKNHLPVETNYSAEALAKAAAGDKKRSGDQITLVIPRRIGSCELKMLPVSDLLSVIQAGMKFNSGSGSEAETGGGI